MLRRTPMHPTMLRRTAVLSAAKYTGRGFQRDFHADVMVRDFYEKHLAEIFSHAVFGYALRVAFASSFAVLSYMVGRRLLCWSEEATPLSKRRFQRWVPATFIDRTQEGVTDMFVYRFALPNSFDYTGHDCFSSCAINLKNSRNPTRRFYTPINHPDQRGIIEFAIKHHNPGEMSNKLAACQPGEVVHVGNWISEMPYEPNEFDHLGFIAAGSGITPFLQLLTCALSNPQDKTRFSLLFANDSPEVIPFKSKLLAVQERFPERLSVDFVVTRGTQQTQQVVLPRASKALRELGVPLSTVANTRPSATANLLSGGAVQSTAMMYDDSGSRGGAATAIRSVPRTSKDYVGYQGFVDRDLILETMPLPNEPRTKLMVCAPSRMMMNLCGNSVQVWRFTYLQGMYDGILRQMGYARSQVYKFGYTFHPMAYDL